MPTLISTRHTSTLPNRGESRMEYYTPTKSEPFGLNKRTRRLAKGILTTKPDGSVDPMPDSQRYADSIEGYPQGGRYF
jgi:hypothetical protein